MRTGKLVAIVVGAVIVAGTGAGVVTAKTSSSAAPNTTTTSAPAPTTTAAPATTSTTSATTTTVAKTVETIPSILRKTIAAPPTFSGTDCGRVETSKPNQKIIVLRGATCEEASTTFAQWDAFTGPNQPDGSIPPPTDNWTCSIGKDNDGFTVVCAAYRDGEPDTYAYTDAAHAFVVVDDL